MLKKLLPFLIVFYLQSCQLSPDANKKLVGTWEVTSYRLESHVNIDEDLLLEFERDTERKLMEFAEYNFNQDSSYHFVFSPMNEDRGKWSKINDSTFIFESLIYHEKDTVYIYFNGDQLATIIISDDNQTAFTNIRKR